MEAILVLILSFNGVDLMLHTMKHFSVQLMDIGWVSCLSSLVSTLSSNATSSPSDRPCDGMAFPPYFYC